MTTKDEQIKLLQKEVRRLQRIIRERDREVAQLKTGWKPEPAKLQQHFSEPWPWNTAASLPMPSPVDGDKK